MNHCSSLVTLQAVATTANRLQLLVLLKGSVTAIVDGINVRSSHACHAQLKRMRVVFYASPTVMHAALSVCTCIFTTVAA
jgi:hypothetical protein